MYQSKIDLGKKTRRLVVKELNARLADSIDLMMQAKQAHWNVKGANFIALHQLFDTVVTDAAMWVDDLAERAVTLGGVALGTARVVAKQSKLAEYPLTISAGSDHIEALSSALASYGAAARTAINIADKLGDAGTADLFTGISRAVDKHLWFIEAHAQRASSN
jgi:starvation-inducible DNA-binding protein